MTDRLYRSKDDKILGGVCGGLAEYFDLDPSLVRLAAILLIFSGVEPILYLIAWLIIPRESEVKGEETTEESSNNKGEVERNDLDYESPESEEEDEENQEK